MNTEILKDIENYYNEICKDYGVSCRLFGINRYTYLDEKDYFLVFGGNGVPEELNVKDLYMRQERTNIIFYTDYFIVRLDEDSDKLSIVGAAVSYCKTIEFLKKIYSEHGVQLPEKIRGDEIHGLKEYNNGRVNTMLSIDARADFQDGLTKFFKQERSRRKLMKKWSGFFRSDKFDRNSSRFKMLFDFLKRSRQIATIELLQETNSELNAVSICEHEYRKFKEKIKDLHPEIMYAISKKEVQNEGFDIKRNKNKPVHKIKRGPFGKCITYEAYCEEREKRFANEGYDAIIDLNPSYYVTRTLTFKKVDEPIIAGILNSISFAYAKSDSLKTVSIPGLDIVSFIDVPVSDMMNFVSLAKANKVAFYMDFYGKFGKPNFEKIRIVYSSSKENIMEGIVSRMINEKFDLSHIRTSIDNNPNSLKNNHPVHPEISNKTKNIQL